MYAPKKKFDDDDDDISESDEEVVDKVMVEKNVKKSDQDDKPVVQIDPAEIERLTKYFENSRIEMEKVVIHLSWQT
jgi:hypothetical protein